ncbi:MAG: MSHA biogenesis protein MshI [Cellvibrio sp. 79]|nr:MAG: MSHA biogenesis protein MshI [Cellvibrio sp. 79]
MQQINLYLPEFQPNREPLRSIHMLWGFAVFIGLLLLTTYLSAQSNREFADQLEKSRAHLEQLKSQVAQLDQQRPQSNLADLDAQSLRLTQELSRREQIFEVIANKNIGNNTGFSAHLQALGRQSLETLSLDAFSLLAGGNYLEFAGKTRSVDQVPLYIQRLRSEAVFAQSAFGVLHAEPQTENKSIFEFSLAKEVKEPSADTQEKEAPQTAVQMLMKMNEHLQSQAQGDN